MKQKIAYSLLCLTLFTAVFSVVRTMGRDSAKPVFAPSSRISRTLVIDPGHGGEDGGAISVSGVSESQVNLSIALKCDQVAGLLGVPVVLLRNEDCSLAPPEADSLREKKRGDLTRRVEVTEQTPNGWLLSIHQNKFEQPSSRGAQVFYRPSEKSKGWAEHVQALLREQLDPGNHRVIKEIPDSIYLMAHVSCPAILVECGFLSNPEEDALLQQEDYQKKLAVLLMGGFLTQTTEEGIIPK